MQAPRQAAESLWDAKKVSEQGALRSHGAFTGTNSSTSTNDLEFTRRPAIHEKLKRSRCWAGLTLKVDKSPVQTIDQSGLWQNELRSGLPGRFPAGDGRHTNEAAASAEMSLE